MNREPNREENSEFARRGNASSRGNVGRAPQNAGMRNVSQQGASSGREGRPAEYRGAGGTQARQPDTRRVPQNEQNLRGVNGNMTRRVPTNAPRRPQNVQNAGGAKGMHGTGGSRRKKKKNNSRLLLLIAVIALIAVFVAVLAVSFGNKGDTDESSSAESEAIPVIVGVKPEVTVYEDDTAEEIERVLLEGVATDTGKDTVKVYIISADGERMEKVSAGTYFAEYYCDNDKIYKVRNSVNVKQADKTPPVITGVNDKVVPLGSSISYRDGVSVTDNDDANVQLNIDNSKVDLTKLGVYSVTYSATDKRGNTASAVAKITVYDAGEKGEITTSVCTKEELDALCEKILREILTDGMTERQKAEAIYNRVRQIKYVNNAKKEHWVAGAYTGLTTYRGDCFNYYAASKALLTLAGIPNYDMVRVGGTSDHYWNIAYVDGGWYHFDACPTPNEYPIRCFLYTEEEARAYTEKCRIVRPNYYVYDYESCPYEVVWSRNS